MALPSQNQNQQQDSAVGFINIGVYDKNGEYAKLGAIPVRESVKNHASIIPRLLEDPESVKRLAEKFVVTFNTTSSEGRDIEF